ncbi:MAG: hypothetical protein WDZ94_00975 [Patescibacteria group bacterium]
MNWSFLEYSSTHASSRIDTTTEKVILALFFVFASKSLLPEDLPPRYR